MEVTSNHESADDMAAALTPEKEEQPKPKVIRDKGEDVEEEPKEGLSKAASDLGKKGGKAAAKARKAAEKEAKPDDDEDGARPAAEARKGADRDAGDEAEGDADAEGVEADREEDSRRENPRHSAQARIRELAEERRVARERAERAEREVQEVRQRLERLERGERPAERQEARPQAAAQDLPPGFPAKPQSGDFEDYEDYLEARDMWRDALRDYRQAEAAHKMREDYAVHQRKTAFAKSFSTAAAEIPDFQTRVSPDVMGLEVSDAVKARGERPTGVNFVADQLFSAPERAPALALYLSEHPQDLQRIAALQSPRAVTWELAKLDAKLSDAATAGSSSGREVSKAKPPVTPVTGSPHTDSGELDDDAPLSAHIQRWGQREQKASRR